jgi:hypothetical protein
MRSFGLSITFVLLAIKASATPLYVTSLFYPITFNLLIFFIRANITDLEKRQDVGTATLYTDNACQHPFAVLYYPENPAGTGGCRQPHNPIGSVAFYGVFDFNFWADGICIEKVELVSDGGDCYAFEGYVTANSYGYVY